MQGGLPILQRVTAQTQEATLMAVQDGDHQLFVHYVEGPQQLSAFGEPGKLGRLHCAGQGKALVAFAPPEERERVLRELELKPMTPVTITDRAAFRAEIEKVRTQGWALANEEHEAGIQRPGPRARRHRDRGDRDRRPGLQGPGRGDGGALGAAAARGGTRARRAASGARLRRATRPCRT